VQLYGRITACRIVVKGPGHRHKTGGLYEINIRLALPDGREVDIGQTPKGDERHSDLPFAINDAFKRAGRRLQDSARRMEGMVKSHEGQPIGTVIRLDPPVNSDSFDQAMATRSTFTATAFLTERFPNWLSAPGSCLPTKSAKRARRQPRLSCSESMGGGFDCL
jgi:hypothetical protein